MVRRVNLGLRISDCGFEDGTEPAAEARTNAGEPFTTEDTRLGMRPRLKRSVGISDFGSRISDLEEEAAPLRVSAGSSASWQGAAPASAARASAEESFTTEDTEGHGEGDGESEPTTARPGAGK